MTIDQAIHLGIQHHQNGRLAEAEKIYREVIARQPENARVFVNALNNLGAILRDKGEFEEAQATLTKAVQLDPGFALAHNNLANALRDQGKLNEAISAYSRAVQLKPDYAEAYNNLGNALSDAGRDHEAVAAFHRAIELHPNFFQAYNNLGNTLRKQSKPELAIAALEHALRIRPDLAEAHNNLGNVFRDQRQFDRAVACYRKAIQLRSSYAEAYSNLGCALADQGKLDEAMSAYSEGIQLKPSDVQVYLNFADALRTNGRLDEAVSMFRTAIAMAPKHIEAHNNLGAALADLGLLDDAMASYERAIEISGGNAAIASNLLYMLPFHPAFDAGAIKAAAERWNQRHVMPLAPHCKPHGNYRVPDRRLRIGYISPYFYNHCQSFFTLPLLSHHDHERFEIFCYSDVIAPDALTDRLRGYADVWRSIRGMSHSDVAEMIRADQIDILIDLAVHMGHNRLEVFGYKPAPVQVTWLGYPGTTGMQTMDYRLSDPFLDPPDADEPYTERTIRLPDTFWCYDPLDGEPLVNESPAARNGHVTFGCLNNFMKVNEGNLQRWANVLAGVPGSRFLLLAPEGASRNRVISSFEGAGIDRSRIHLTGRLPRADYLKLYHEIDIALDTLPYNGHTTTLDCLWMGVPLVSQIGRTVVGRAGFSQLSNLQLTELVGDDRSHYVRIATELAADLPRLNGLRSTLRQRMLNSPLMDAKKFAGAMENALRGMWQAWCAGEGKTCKQGEDAKLSPSSGLAGLRNHL